MRIHTTTQLGHHMITQLTHMTLFVDDQNKALEFYTQKLGFKLHTDAPFGTDRWLTVCPAQQPNFEIYLALATTPEQIALVGKQGDTIPFFCLASDDCLKTYEEFVRNGVTIVNKPEQHPWGISIVVKDMAGNLINVTQVHSRAE